MQLKRLSLTHFRVFEQAEFEFQPGMSLLVGVNGAGKSTVLDSLRILLSQILPKFTASKNKPVAFEENDIAIGCESLTAELNFAIFEHSFTYLVHKQKDAYGVNEAPTADQSIQYGQHVDRRTRIKRRREQQEAFHSAERSELTPDENSISKSAKTTPEQPFVLYFSTRRSLPSMEAPSKASTAGGQGAAFADALAHRELRLREFADWWLVQEALAQETEQLRFDRNLSVLSDTVMRFLDGCTNLRAIREPKVSLLVDEKGKTLDLRQLSDGERSMTALVLDLARRLALANPKLADPVHDGKAIVLIDELDLHLHPRWQRDIVQKLTRTFPNCQFIATTHSPQIVGEVSPDNIIMLEGGRAYRPNQSLGMDSNWVLHYLMGARDRNLEIDQELDRIGDLLEDEEFEQAAIAINQLRDQIGDFPALVRLQTRLDRLQLLGI